MKTKIFFIGLLFAVFFLLTSSYAQEIIPPYYFSTVPQMINYQGKLTKLSGTPLDTTISMVFSIYSDEEGTNLLWTETQAMVVVEKGVFSVLLGSVNLIPFSVFNGSARYLGVKVGGDPEITPRKAMVSVPYALTSAGRWQCANDTNGYVYIDPGKFTGCSVAYIRLNERRNHNVLEINAYDEEWGNMILTQDPGNASGQGLGIHGGVYMAPFERFVVNTDAMFLGYSIKPGNGAGASGGDGVGNLYVHGNVGIGTTSPSHKLDIAGSARVQDSLRVNGTIKLHYDWTYTTQIIPGNDVTLTHNLGGDPEKYIVYMVGISSQGHYIHQKNYGTSYRPLGYLGCEWGRLTSTTITVSRGSLDDSTAPYDDWDSTRVCILKNQ